MHLGGRATARQACSTFACGMFVAFMAYRRRPSVAVWTGPDAIISGIRHLRVFFERGGRARARPD